ncbi:MAG: integrase [Pseudonocardiaceae bacterium]|nr:integrase [Pseudonocardiaceae bacterium]
MTSNYDVRIWSIRKYKGKRATTYTVRWSVGGRAFPETFATSKLAESFRSKLLTAAREGVPFDESTGLPEPMARARNSRTWYEHACDFVDIKWPRASARHRKSIAEALANVTPALLATERGAPDPDELRRVLRTWSFNSKARHRVSSSEAPRAAQWAAQNTMKVSELADTAVIRRALDTLALTLDGKAAGATTIARKRAVFYGALRYAVERGLLEANPIDRVQWVTPKDAAEVDSRVVVNPQQARDLVAAVREVAPSLEAFFATIYYAGLRPAEVLHLREADCKLPDTGWGELLLTGSTQHVGEAWGDGDDAREDRGLKHRPRKDTRRVPACPDLVRVLRGHLETFGVQDGRLFVVRTGAFGTPTSKPYANAVSPVTYAAVWRKARARTLTEHQVASPLARRPYDLRHACVSLWLNAGVPATQVAEWAGHSVHVLMRVYAKCIYGQDEAARRRIEAALAAGGPRQTSGPA